MPDSPSLTWIVILSALIVSALIGAVFCFLLARTLFLLNTYLETQTAYLRMKMQSLAHASALDSKAERG